MSRDDIYRVDMKRLVLLTLPTWLRRPVAAALLFAGVTPLARALQELRNFRTESRYRITHNGQVCKLRGVLNDECDPYLRRIRVEDYSKPSGMCVYERESRQWIMTGRSAMESVRLERRGFAGSGQYDFRVEVPEVYADEGTMVRLRGKVDLYKLAGKRYEIQFF